MEKLARILIILILVMVVSPCGDAAEIEAQQMEQITTASVSNGLTLEQDAHNQHEQCSPICPCQCCPSTAGVAIEISQRSAIIPLFLSPDYKNRFSSPFITLVWSPPQPVS